jgi:hypothetical protein
MRKGLHMSLRALDLIDANANDEAIRVLKQSEIESGTLKIFDLDKTRTALLKCKPNNPDAMFVKSFLFDDISRTIRFLELCLRVFPRDAHLHRRLACVCINANRMDKALHAINTALALDSTHPRWLYLRAACSSSSSIDADRDYVEANEIDDVMIPQVYYAMSRASMRMKMAEDAKVFWEMGELAEMVRLKHLERVGEASKPIDFVK